MLKSALRGRTLQVMLGTNRDDLVENLKETGFSQERAANVAEAALQFANEETDVLIRQLTPKSVWPGIVVLRRHENIHRDSSWLVLKHMGEQGWLLEAALFT